MGPNDYGDSGRVDVSASLLRKTFNKKIMKNQFCQYKLT